VPIGAASPTSEEMSDGIAVLVGEISEAFAGDRRAILNSATDQVKWRLYDGAALRHCCQLLQEMDLAARSGQEFSVRLLQRAHIEAWLTGLYIHYGGFAAVTRVGQDTLHHLEASGNEAAAIDQWLAGERPDCAHARPQGAAGQRRHPEMERDEPGPARQTAAHRPTSLSCGQPDSTSATASPISAILRPGSCIVAAPREGRVDRACSSEPGILVRSGTVSIVSTGSTSLVKVRCGVPSCRRLLARVVALSDGQNRIVLSADAAEGAQWLADSGRSARSGPAFTVPAEGVVPVAPCPRHTQWATDQHGLRRGSDRNISETAERTGISITVMRTAYVDAARLAEPIRHAVRTGREGTLLVMPSQYIEA
jgi:hypothetical protein